MCATNASTIRVCLAQMTPAFKCVAKEPQKTRQWPMNSRTLAVYGGGGHIKSICDTVKTLIKEGAENGERPSVRDTRDQVAVQIGENCARHRCYIHVIRRQSDRPKRLQSEYGVFLVLGGDALKGGDNNSIGVCGSMSVFTVPLEEVDGLRLSR